MKDLIVPLKNIDSYSWDHVSSCKKATAHLEGPSSKHSGTNTEKRPRDCLLFFLLMALAEAEQRSGAAAPGQGAAGAVPARWSRWPLPPAQPCRCGMSHGCARLGSTVAHRDSSTQGQISCHNATTTETGRSSEEYLAIYGDKKSVKIGGRWK